MDATFLTFRGQYYQQISGTAMGPPASVTIANMVEERALSTYTPASSVWKRYVDDVPERCISEFHNHLTSVSPNIQFTIEEEEEKDGSLPFLDALIERQTDGTVLTSVFWKTIYTYKYLEFSSHHPLTHRFSVIKTLYTRAKEISTTRAQRATEETHVLKALQMNGYPKHLIQKVASRISRRPSIASSPSPDQEPVARLHYLMFEAYLNPSAGF